MDTTYSPIISLGRSREGAWIEINVTAPTTLKPYGRSREGAWIEIPEFVGSSLKPGVAPVRERGLKYLLITHFFSNAGSLP